ncbi:MAG TPA: penicillin acylase family protein [Segetibacter sp.]
MRILLLITSAIITISLIFALNTSLNIAGNKTPRFGNFLSPATGFWQNAEPANAGFSEDLNSGSLKGKADVYFDERLVPHVYAEKENDVYFVQGYLHAKFRLWQMEFQTHVAAGRLSEIMGEGKSFLDKDRFFRRLGMVYAAEQSLKAAEADEVTKNELDAYTLGVNAYIETLKPAAYPLEYKLLDYKPEKWTNLKTQLFLKYMAFQLAGFDSDFEMTNAQSVFSAADIEMLYPTIQDSLDPIVAKGTALQEASVIPKKPVNVDSFYFHKTKTADSAGIEQPDKNNGSNNWAVAAKKTKNGAPILCNDPHLALSLPSLWYEMQLSTPTFNSYGVSLPGSPSVIIGFNDSCAWGITNASRDVKDYFEITFRDSTMNEYLFNGKWEKSAFRTETIKVKGKPDITERIAMTSLGPVMYDKNYPNILKNGKSYAVRWVAHDASNELLALNKINHANSYTQFSGAVLNYQCPGQNFVFAAKNGDIAIKQQGKFPAKWQRQGDFLMPGTDSSYLWQAFIPFKENPEMYNPERGFVSSANQLAANNYPYYLAGRSAIYRAKIINRRLSEMSGITVEDMQQLQTDNYDIFAEEAIPLLLKYTDISKLSQYQLTYVDKLKNWNLKNDYNEEGPTILDFWWKYLQKEVFTDEFAASTLPLRIPDNSTLLEGLIKDSTFKFVDNIATPAVESLRDIVLIALKEACVDFEKAKRKDLLKWGNYKSSEVKHILNLSAFSKLKLHIGGNQNSINATTRSNGPGWRMVVQLSANTEAYGVYAGGQSGNAGSRYYDNFIDTWAAGKYYTLLFLTREQARNSDKIKWKMLFNNSQNQNF